MSLDDMTNDDNDDNQSLSSSTNTDEDYIPSNCHTHRTCSRYAPCNKKNHRHLLVDSSSSLCQSKNNKDQAVKGDVRPVPNEEGHQQKYDGTKWRRICSESDCSMYLNGGIFYEKWLCRKHYLIHFPGDSSDVLNRFKSTMNKSRKSTWKLSNEDPSAPKRGDIRLNNDNIRQRYNGKSWRPICNYTDCKSYVIAYGFCHRHNLETRRTTSQLLSSLNDIPQRDVSLTISPTQSISLPKKGDIQMVRQQWNGTKWYPLCNYHTQDCSRRSSGVKHGHLCDKHYKESLEKNKERQTSILLSPTVKRKRSVHRDSLHSFNSTPSQSTIDRLQQTERCIQTDLTYPLESNDLRQGCFFIDDESDDLFQCNSSPLRVHVKKEEENFGTNKRKYFDDLNSLSFNCKLEITKLEF